MARVYLEEEWKTSLDLEKLRSKIFQYFSQSGTKILISEIGRIVGEQGSQTKSRFVGIWLSKYEYLPKRITITYQDTFDHRAIRVRIEETLGFGILDSKSKDKYMDAFRNYIEELKMTCGRSMIMTSMQDASTLHPKKEVIKEINVVICPKCGYKNRQDLTLCVNCGVPL